MDLKSSKIRPKIVQNRGFGGLGVAWGVFGEIWLRISREIVAQVRPRGSRGSVKLEQERPKLAHVGAKMATWCSTWRFWGGFEVDSASILGAFSHMGRIVKIVKIL